MGNVETVIAANKTDEQVIEKPKTSTVEAKLIDFEPERLTIKEKAVELIQDENQEVSDTARNGMITAHGIIIGFALTYFPHWAMTGTRWYGRDLLTFVLLLAGIVVVLLSFFKTLSPYRQNVGRWNKNVRWFTAGILLLSSGMIVSAAISLMMAWPHKW